MKQPENQRLEQLLLAQQYETQCQEWAFSEAVQLARTIWEDYEAKYETAFPRPDAYTGNPFCDETLEKLREWHLKKGTYCGAKTVEELQRLVVDSRGERRG